MQTLNLKRAWQAVLTRDRRYDGTFVYAVASTRVYCRPSCPARRPSPSRVTFFDTPCLAEEAGFRPCRRCRPGSAEGPEIDQRIEQARQYLDRHYDEPVGLRHLAAEIGISPSHLHRMFSALVGCSPKQYQDLKRMDCFKTTLKSGTSVTHAAYAAGFGSSSRVYERVNDHLGMTPSAVRAGGLGVSIRFTTAPTAAGRLLLAATARGIVSIQFGTSDAALLSSLRREYPNAAFRRDPGGLKRRLTDVLGSLTAQGRACRFPLDLNATAFQRRVWKALQQIPAGGTRSYREIAASIGQPSAARAVANACASNPIAMAIPCHRVVRQDGRLGGYQGPAAQAAASGTGARRDNGAETMTIRARLAQLDWKAIETSLWQHGYAKVARFLTAEECAALRSLYDEDDLFRSRIDMRRFRFGEGEYKYFKYPLPPLIHAIREHAYPRLATVANAWSRALAEPDAFPARLDELLAVCRKQGQTKATPLLLRYTAGGYNCLHQDLYGEVAFPLQLTVFLSRRDRDFTGGEFLLVEQRPRAQSRGEVLRPEQGDMVVFATRHRPVPGTRGYYRVTMRHGVSTIHSGSRVTLGVIFHDAK